MSFFVLDTDILTLLQGDDATVRQHIAAHLPQEVAITVLTVEEQVSGWYTYLRKAKQIDQLVLGYQSLIDTIYSVSSFQILSFERPSIQRYESLRKSHLNVRKMDLRIAAIVLEKNATLVTRNVRDLKQVPGLTFVDWSQ